MDRDQLYINKTLIWYLPLWALHNIQHNNPDILCHPRTLEFVFNLFQCNLYYRFRVIELNLIA